MTDAQSVTIAVTLFAIFGAMLYNRKSVEGMRDVLRAEAKTGTAEIKAELKVEITPMSKLVIANAWTGSTEKISRND